MNSCMNCANINCTVEGKSKMMICAEYLKSNFKSTDFTDSELKILLSLLRQVNSIDGDVNAVGKLTNKIIGMIGE